MPNILDDGLLDQATVCHVFSTMPTNPDFMLQAVIGAAINTACALGNLTCSVSVASYTAANANDASQRNDLIQRIIERLVNMGYTATLSGTTLTVNW